MSFTQCSTGVLQIGSLSSATPKATPSSHDSRGSIGSGSSLMLHPLVNMPVTCTFLKVRHSEQAGFRPLHGVVGTLRHSESIAPSSIPLAVPLGVEEGPFQVVAEVLQSAGCLRL